MRFTRTAVGWRIESNNRKTLKMTLKGVQVHRWIESGYLIVRVTDGSERASLVAYDEEIKRKLNIPKGPWDPVHETLLVKCGRACAFWLGGLRAGGKDDFPVGTTVDLDMRLGGAWPDGYSWVATNLKSTGLLVENYSCPAL